MPKHRHPLKKWLDNNPEVAVPVIIGIVVILLTVVVAVILLPQA